MNDLISRQAAIDALIEWYGCEPNDIDAFKEIIYNKPSAQPERKKGKWVCSDDMYETAVCSCCGWDTTDPWDHIRHWFKYCPHCGAKMEVEG